MSSNKSNWDRFPKILQKRRSSGMGRAVASKNMDDLFAEIKEISDIYRQRRRNSTQSINWSFEDMSVSISSDDSQQSDENSFVENDANGIPPLDNDTEEDEFASLLSTSGSDYQMSADNEEKNDNNMTENPSKSSSDSQTESLRRSQRYRIPVMESWRGQRPIYKRDSTGLTEKIVGIEKGTPYDVSLRTKNRKKRKNSSKNKSNKNINILNLSIHNKKVKINDQNIDKNKDSLNIKSLEDLNWKASSLSKGVDIAIINKDKEKSEAVGMIRIKGRREKTMSKTGNYRTYLTVVFGALNLKIEDFEEVVIKSCSSFEIKAKTNYSLVNLRKDIAYISFTVFSN